MIVRRVVAYLMACMFVIGCSYLQPPYPRPIKIKHHKHHDRESRFWAGESGDVQGWVMPLALVSPTRNQPLREAVKDEYTFFVVAMHHKTSDEGLDEAKANVSVQISIRNQMFSNVDGMAVIGPLLLNRINELKAERSRLTKDVSGSTETPAPTAKSPEAQSQLAKVEHDIELLNQLRAYLRPGRIETKRGVVWFQLVAVPGKEDIAAIQNVQWGYGGGPLVDLNEYGYSTEMVDKLKLKEVADRPWWVYLPGFMEPWFAKRQKP